MVGATRAAVAVQCKLLVNASSGARAPHSRAAPHRPKNANVLQANLLAAATANLAAASAALADTPAAATAVADSPDAVVDGAVVSDAITSAVQAAESAVEAVEQAVAAAAAKSPPVLTEAVQEAEKFLKEAEAAAGTDGGAVALAVEEAAEAIEKASEAATSSGVDLDILNAVAAATAAIQEAAAAALESTGVDPAAVAATAAAGAGVATGVAQNVFTFLTTTEPSVLAYDALGAVGVAWLGPPLAKAGWDAARGYSGDVLPTTALDCLASANNSVLVDIRAAAQKAAVGLPDLPDNGKLVELEYVQLGESDEELRDPQGVCAESTAVRIAALKKLNTGKLLYIMDERGSGPARAVAKQLRKRGYKQVFTVSGGAAAWAAAKLSTRPSQLAAALLPSPADAERKAAEAGQPAAAAEAPAIAPALAAPVAAAVPAAAAAVGAAAAAAEPKVAEAVQPVRAAEEQTRAGATTEPATVESVSAATEASEAQPEVGDASPEPVLAAEAEKGDETVAVEAEGKPEGEVDVEEEALAAAISVVEAAMGGDAKPASEAEEEGETQADKKEQDAKAEAANVLA